VTSTLTDPATGAVPPGLGRRYLMCPPTYFTVRYRINPWMQPDEPVDTGRAVAQWERLRAQLIEFGHEVALMTPRRELPDLVFTANGGIVVGDRALVPRFRHPERQGESPVFAEALRGLGISDVAFATHVNEGEGDFLLTGGRFLAGTGLRSAPGAADEVAEFFDVPVVPLTLVDPRFYHLDTALARLRADAVVYWPGAFDERSQGVLSDLFPEAVLSDEADAAALALNMVSDGQRVIMAPGRDRLAAQIAERGFEVVTLSTDELRKAGGGAKCCVLERHELSPDLATEEPVAAQP
jgi:N-dimethylarginine dimethylaminohydrolase